jgi:hypothetical protein
MPSPFLLATAGQPSELYCSLCKTKFVRPDLSSQPTAHEAKAAFLKEWDDHLYAVHRRQGFAPCSLHNSLHNKATDWQRSRSALCCVRSAFRAYDLPFPAVKTDCP